MKDDLVTLVVIMIVKDTATFQVLFIVLYSVLGTSLLWRSKVAFTYLKVKSAKCPGLKNWSCLHYCRSQTDKGKTITSFAEVIQSS